MNPVFVQRFIQLTKILRPILLYGSILASIFFCIFIIFSELIYPAKIFFILLIIVAVYFLREILKYLQSEELLQ